MARKNRIRGVLRAGPPAGGGDRSTPNIARGSIPLYFQIEKVIRNRIRSGEYSPDVSLPGEGDLSREFGVSRSTVRQALSSLQREQLIIRQPGKGTFVTNRDRDEGFAGPLGSIEDIFTYARETTYQLLSMGPVEAPPDVAQLLKVPPGARLMEYHGLRARSGPPFVYIKTWLPMNIGQQITREVIKNDPIVVLIENLCGIHIGEVQQGMSATLADQEVARILNVPKRSPVLLVKRLYFSSDGVPVDYSINHFSPARFEYHARLLR